VIDGVEGSSEVKEYECAELARVCRRTEVVGDFKESGFSAVLKGESRLKRFMKVVRVEVGFDL